MGGLNPGGIPTPRIGCCKPVGIGKPLPIGFAAPCPCCNLALSMVGGADSILIDIITSPLNTINPNVRFSYFS